MKNPTLKTWAPALFGIAAALTTFTAKATPYASGITNNAGLISFILNEPADNVKVVFNGGSSTNDLGARVKGVHSFSLGGNSSFEIQVTKNAGPGYVHTGSNGTDAVVQQISDDTNSNVKFWSPRGVAINRDPSSPYFGRIYVGNATAGTTGGRFTDIGIFMMNADGSSAHASGYEDTPFNPDFRLVGSGSSPWELKVGPDNNLYMADWTDSFGNLLVSPPDMSSITPVLKPTVGSAATPVGADNTHGSITAMHIEGSLQSGNLKVYTIDEDLQSDKTSTVTNQLNSLWRYDVGAEALPYQNDAVKIFTPGVVPNTGINFALQTMALDRGTNGYFYVTDYRSGGTDTSGLIILDENGTPIWNSRQASIDLVGGTTDLLASSYKVAVRPDQKYVAVAKIQNIVWIIPLTNGIPDLSKRKSLTVFGAGQTGRGIAFDAANNLYAVNSSAELMRVFSPGGSATAITKSDGTFSLKVPETSVTISSSTSSTYENTATPVVFTVSRSGDLTSPLTVFLSISGTAAGGTDYTPVIPSSVTFAANASSTNISITAINNNVAQLSRTLALNVLSTNTYSVGTPGNAALTILDDESPELSVELAQAENRLLEGYSAAKLGFRVVRKGLLTPALTANIGYSGSAIRGTHFDGSLTVSVPANAAGATFNVTSINDEIYQGDRTIIASAIAGSGYSVAANNSATGILVDDEYPAGTILFSDDFNTPSNDTSSKWDIFSEDSFADSHADFGFDYTTLGVPQRVGSSDTLGLRLRSNQAANYLNNITAVPKNLNLGTNDYRVKFNMWINYNGPLFDGGPGSTFHFNAGVGTSGTHVNWQNRTNDADGVWFSVDGDGGSTFVAGDVNAYVGSTLQGDESGVYAAGTNDLPRSTGSPYYAMWGGLSAPPAQLTAYPGQTGTSQEGNMGISWHTVVITKASNTVQWAIDGVIIATVTNNPVSLGNNVFVGYQKQFTGSLTSIPDMSFAVIDDFKVESYSSAPAESPVITVSHNGNNITLTWSGSGFTLEEASTITGTWSTVNGATSGYTTSTASGTKFYRLKQ